MNDSKRNSVEQSIRQTTPHIKLFIPGPTEVREETLDAQGGWMVGHRMSECSDLIGRIQPKLRHVFMTKERPVIIAASSGTGLLEAAIRNCSDRKVLNCVNGAFSDRWREITEFNGKRNEVLEVAWGQPILPEQVAQRLESGGFDAITVAHNETSTGVTNPIEDIVRAVRNSPGGEKTMALVDSVSGLAGARLAFDDWDIDVAVTSSQKALALPPGLAFCAVSERAMEKAKRVPDRGYYFDFLTLNKYLNRDQTPATPAISLLYALDHQLSNILDEGLENRFQRHLAMRDHTLAWAADRGLKPFSAAGFESPTVSCIDNPQGFSIPALNAYLRDRGMIISDGYGAKLKGKTFRIAHMGELQLADMEHLLSTIDHYLETAP